MSSARGALRLMLLQQGACVAVITYSFHTFLLQYWCSFLQKHGEKEQAKATRKLKKNERGAALSHPPPPRGSRVQTLASVTARIQKEAPLVASGSDAMSVTDLRSHLSSAATHQPRLTTESWRTTMAAPGRSATITFRCSPAQPVWAVLRGDKRHNKPPAA